MLGGSGWGIHGWHKIHEAIIAGNFVSGMRWGIVVGQYGDEGKSNVIPPTSDNVVVGNIVWKVQGAGNFGTEPPIGMWIDGERMIVSGNIFGPEAPVISLSFCENPQRTAPRQNILIGQNIPERLCEGNMQFSLEQMEEHMGLSSGLVDFMIEELLQIYKNPETIISRSEEKEQYELLLRFNSWPDQSELNTGSFDWQNPVCSAWDNDMYWWAKQQNYAPYGPPGVKTHPNSNHWDIYRDFMIDFHQLGLRQYDNDGKVVEREPPACSRHYLPLISK